MYFKSIKNMQFIDYILKIFSYINLFSGSWKKKKFDLQQPTLIIIRSWWYFECDYGYRFKAIVNLYLGYFGIRLFC